MKYDTSFKDVYLSPVGAPAFCYRTGLTVYEETFRGGMLVSAGWNTAGYPLDVLSGDASRLRPEMFWEPSAFRLSADGCDVSRFLEYDGFDKREDGGSVTAEVRLKSTLKPISISVVTSLDGSAAFERCLKITNTGDESIALSGISIMSGGVDLIDRSQKYPYGDIGKMYSLGYFINDGGCMEGDFEWRDLAPDVTSISGRWGRERHRHPMFMLRNNVMGTILYGQMGWSGGYRFDFDVQALPENDRAYSAFNAALAGWAPLYVLDPGETLVTPSMHIGMIAGGLDDAVNAMNVHFRRSVLNMPEAAEPQMYVGGGMGPEHDMSVETTKQFMDQLARMGAEVFIIDAGWYMKPGMQGEWYKTGNWHDDRDRYPNGIIEMRDYARKKGMMFGMWMEPERLGDEEVMKAHPDWLSRYPDGSVSGFLDMTNPEAAAWAEAETARCIEEYGMDLLRIDYNVGSHSYFHFGERNGIKEDLSIRHFQAVYSMYERLKKRFPNVVFENCAGGGGRTDVGMLRYFSHSWVSDRQIAPRSLMITNGMTMALPPERVDRLVAGMGCHTAGTLDYHMRNAMFGHVSLNVLSPREAAMNDDAFGFIEREVKIYKEFIRTYICDSLIFHHTESTDSMKRGETAVLELASSDLTRDAIGVFSAAGSNKDEIIVYPRGLDAGKDYIVTLDNSGQRYEAYGADMMNGGIRVRIPSGMSSELILIQSE
ncbi:MAG: alpha-galactosidase [Clostridiales bacterium]|nr:alpha-galactosidase [Clostridiales bacterium]